MIIDLGIYQLDIDPERTAAFYAEADGISCDCDGCRNYAKAVAVLPSPVLELFRQFGIDPAKPAEVYVNSAPTQDTAGYGGFYHVCGTVLEGKSPWIKVDGKHFRFDEQYRVDLCDGYSIFITDEIHLLEEGFPHPVIQIEIDFLLPWVLPITKPY